MSIRIAPGDGPAGRTPRTAMILAAGLGTRLRPLTDSRPKPLIAVAGRTMLDRVIDRLAEAGVRRFVINMHYMADQIAQHVRVRAAAEPALDFRLSDETDRLLDTGGGIARALPLLEDALFYAVNADMIWVDGFGNSLRDLAHRWHAQEGPQAGADALLLLHPTVTARGYAGQGDFTMAPDGRLSRRPERQVSPFVFTGVQLLHARLFDDCVVEPFSLNRLYDLAIARGRLFGLRHQGLWVDAGHPEGLTEAGRLVSRLERPDGRPAAA